MELKDYLNERTDKENSKYRTVNVDERLHYFFKKTANNYNIAMSDLIYNVLHQWRSEFQEQIKKDVIKNLEN
ncbi:hypothetical protein [Ekhidna sp.]